MKMAQFSLADGKNTQIYINPSHVISVHTEGDYTIMFFAFVGRAASPFFYKLAEDVEVVLHRLAAASAC